MTAGECSGRARSGRLDWRVTIKGLAFLLSLASLVSCERGSESTQVSSDPVSRQWTERAAVEELKNMHTEVVAKKFDTPKGSIGRSRVVSLTNGTWAGEVIMGEALEWDYQATGSVAFPFRGMVAVNVHRWVTRQYELSDRAQVALNLNILFECRENGFPYDPSKDWASSALRHWPMTLVSNLTFDAANKTWLIKSIEQVDSSEVPRWKDRWVKAGSPQYPASPKELHP